MVSRTDWPPPGCIAKLKMQTRRAPETAHKLALGEAKKAALERNDTASGTSLEHSKHVEIAFNIEDSQSIFGFVGLSAYVLCEFARSGPRWPPEE